METIVDKVRGTKFYFGPMSKNIVDAIISYANYKNTTIGLIASRRQIDYTGGYVNNWTTDKFVKYVNSQTNNIIVCRDHGGIGQGITYDMGLESLRTDANNMHVIHIDPWKILDTREAIDYTILAIKQCNKINSSCLYEIGTEEAIRPFTVDELHHLLASIKIAIPDLFDKIIYLVIQSGTAIRAGKNIGIYDETKLLQMINLCLQYNISSKEHNGDYLLPSQIKHKFNFGLSAINIAPELAHIETSIILEHITGRQANQWFDLCMQDGQWKKWFEEGFNPEQNKCEVLKLCGHYVLSKEKFKDIFKLHTISSLVEDEIFNFLGGFNGQ